MRWKINNYIINDLTDAHIKMLNDLIDDYEISFKKRKEIESLNAKDFLNSQHIIAMTTTGRAKNQDYLRDIQFPIVIVEEAAEVFEAHIISALTKNTNHLILIGDHE
jgi:superfamily I DNA and/or RNA helicase